MFFQELVIEWCVFTRILYRYFLLPILFTVNTLHALINQFIESNIFLWNCSKLNINQNNTQGHVESFEWCSHFVLWCQFAQRLFWPTPLSSDIVSGSRMTLFCPRFRLIHVLILPEWYPIRIWFMGLISMVIYLFCPFRSRGCRFWASSCCFFLVKIKICPS